MGDSKACPHCGNQSWDVGLYINAGGHATHPLICAACGYRSTRFIKKKDVAALGLTPVPAGKSPEIKTCEVCGALGAERHHWAPSAFFGDESERWPTSYLCQTCHARWHATVTPRYPKREVGT
jgi:hypothetical protein